MENHWEIKMVQILQIFLKIKFRDLGIRVVYKVERVEDVMKIIVVSARTDEQVYREAARRKEKYEL